MAGETDDLESLSAATQLVLAGATVLGQEAAKAAQALRIVDAYLWSHVSRDAESGLDR
jgi:hypothetical protein